MTTKQTKSIQQHVNEWLQWGYNTLVKYPLEIAIGSAILYIFNSKATTKGKSTNKQADVDAKTQEAIRKLEELLSKKDSKPKSNNNNNDDSDEGFVPFTGSSGLGMLPAGGRNANSELEKLAAASEADDERETADIAPAATIHHGTLTITLGGEAIVIQLAELQTMLAEDSPLQPLLVAAQNLALIQINTDGTTNEIATFYASEEGEAHFQSNKESDRSKEEEEEEEEEDHDGAASDDSNRGEENDDEGMGAPQPTEHLDRNEEDRDGTASDKDSAHGEDDDEGMGAPQPTEHLDRNEEDRDDTASDSNRGGNDDAEDHDGAASDQDSAHGEDDDEGMGAPQLSHHVDDEGAAISGASSPAPEEAA